MLYPASVVHTILNVWFVQSDGHSEFSVSMYNKEEWEL